MRKFLVLGALALFSSLAVAGSCPKLMKQVDAALPKAELSAAQKAEVQKLRADGEAFHKAGRHGDSEAALSQPRLVFGIGIFHQTKQI
jgi:hypothetical protein